MTQRLSYYSTSSSTQPTITDQNNNQQSVVQDPPRPSSSPFRESQVADVEQENSLKDRIRHFTMIPNTSGPPSPGENLSFVGSPDFQATSPGRQQVRTPRRSRSRANSLANSVDHRLSVIDEDNASEPHPPPTIPEQPSRAQHRPFHRHFGLGSPPDYKRGGSPPRYTLWDIKGPNGEAFEDLRNNAYIAKRGGWRRLCIIVWLIVVIIIALAVGLGVGLSRRSKDSSSPPAAASTSASAATGPFPAGSWTFTVYLSQTSTNCTTNPSAFTCEPKQLFSASPSASKTQFQWIIAPSSSDKNALTIKSSNNPFNIGFESTPLTLLDKGQDTERYNFQTTLQKIVYPQASFSTKCFYNSTTFSANLYTKKKSDSDIPAPAATAAPLVRRRQQNIDDDDVDEADDALVNPSPLLLLKQWKHKRQQQPSFAEWPFAADATQSIGSGMGVPDCYEFDNSKPGAMGVGARVTKGYGTNMGAFCSCGYTNWDLSE